MTSSLWLCGVWFGLLWVWVFAGCLFWVVSCGFGWVVRCFRFLVGCLAQVACFVMWVFCVGGAVALLTCYRLGLLVLLCLVCGVV